MTGAERERSEKGEGVMVEAVKDIFLIVSALFPIVNPLGGSPIFLSFTEEYPASMRRALSRQIAINSFSLLIGSYLFAQLAINTVRTLSIDAVRAIRRMGN